MPGESSQMPDDLFQVLQAGVPAILLTVDENGYAHTAFTLAATRQPNAVAVVVDDGSRSLANIERTGRASVQILAPDNQVYLLKGTVQLSSTHLTSSPVPSCRAEIELVSVKNQAWPEIAVLPLSYEYSTHVRRRWESAVPRIYAELRGDVGS
jgi:hypothetical protein